MWWDVWLQEMRADLPLWFSHKTGKYALEISTGYSKEESTLDKIDEYGYTHFVL